MTWAYGYIVNDEEKLSGNAVGLLIC